MRFYSVREAKWITLGAQAKKPGTKGANGKKHGGVAVLIGDDGVILKGPAHMKGKKPDELGSRQKTLGEKPNEKQEPKKYQNLAFGPNGEIAEPDKPKSPPPGAGYSDLRAAAKVEPVAAPTAAKPAKPAKPAKAPKAAKVKPEPKPEPVATPTPEPKPEKNETVRAKIARVKAEKEKRYNDTLKKRGKKEADKQKADDKRQAKASKNALNPAQAEARKKKQVERISKINAARPESLISLVRREGGISGGDYDYATDIKEFGLKSALNKRGLKMDDMAKALQNAGHLVVPEGKKAEDVLLAGLQARANSALHNHTGRYDSEYDDFINNREDADNAPGADSDRTSAVISRGEEAGENQGDDDSLAQILGLEPNRSDADEPEPSDYGHPDDYEPEEGDLGDGGEITGADTSFDFGAPEPEPVKAPAPSPEPVKAPAPSPEPVKAPAPAPAAATPKAEPAPEPEPTPATPPSPGTGYADLRAAAAKRPEAPTITPEPLAASPRDLEKSEQRTPDEHARGELLGNRRIFGELKRTKAEAKEVLAKRIQQILDSPKMSKVVTDFGLTPEQAYTTAKINGKWAVIPSHASDVATATYQGNPVSAEAVQKYGIILPKNYTKQGEMYVATPSQPEEPEQPKPPEPKKKKPPDQRVKGLTDDPEEFQQGDRFKGENGEEFEVFANRQGALTAHPVVDGKPQINKSTEKKFAITDAAAASNPTHRRDFVPGFDQSQPGRDSEKIAQDRARLAKTPPPSPGTGYADLRAAAKEPDRRSYAERISAGESPEKIMAELDQRSDIARSQRDRPEATPAEQATAQAEIQHAQNVSTDKARADFAEKMNKKAADAKTLASVEKPKITIEKSIGYSGKTGDPSYLAKISGKHNGKTFNREFQNGDEDKIAKSNAFRKKKGVYNETHEISPGELYEHAQNGTKKLLAIQPALDGGTAGHRVSFEISELKEASKILKSFDDSETPNANGFGANADFVKPLLAHQAKMAKKTGSYEGLTLPVVARDLEGG